MSKWVKAIEKKEESFDQLLKKLQQPMSEPIDELKLKNRVILLAKISKNCSDSENKNSVSSAADRFIAHQSRGRIDSILLRAKYFHSSRS